MSATCFCSQDLNGRISYFAVITIILEACPCAAITTLFAIKFGHDQKLAVGAVTLSTLISIITLPCLALLAGEIIM